MTKTVKGKDAAILALIDKWEARAKRLRAMPHGPGALCALQIELCADDLRGLMP